MDDRERKPDNRNNKKRNYQLYIILAIVAAVTVALITGLDSLVKKSTTKKVTYDEFVEAVEEGKVDSVKISSARVTFTLTDDLRMTYYTPYLPDSNLLPMLNEAGVEYTGTEDSSGSAILEFILVYILPFALIWILMGFFMRRIGGGSGGMMGIGKANTATNMSRATGVTFADVAGEDEAKESLTEIVDFLHNPQKYVQIGAKLPKGALLVGPPGTGKTLLARAVAGEAKVPFFSLSGSDFVEMFVGVGASRVRDLFKTAQQNAPCIIFIDEIDAVARKRGSGLGGGHDEREQTLNQMLVEMDGFGVNEGIIVMAATNRVDILDPAILRPGRFDRQVTVGRPDVRGREEILRVHARGKTLGDDVDLSKIAHTTIGFTGADLENLLNEAAIACAKDGRSFISQEDVDKSFIKLGIGKEKKSRIVSEHDRKITAYHEAGHAILFHVLPDVGPVHIVSIIPTGSGAGGYTMPISEKDDMYLTKGKMLQDITVSLGGRIAESLVLDDITTGASQDIKQATEQAKAMVTKYGFTKNVGMINYAGEDEVFVGREIGQSSRGYSEDVAKKIDEEVKSIIDSCYERAEEILKENMEVLHKCAALLLEKERIDREEFEKLFAGEEQTVPEN